MTPDAAGRYDVIVVGGGPAGLSAALQLGRARRRTLLVDGGTPRNNNATAVHGLIAMDGRSPAEVRAAAREDLDRYGEVEVREGWVQAVDRTDGGFRVRYGDEVAEARRVVLATGIVDVLPELPGVEHFWGISVVQCPFCHGWELADGPLAFLAVRPDDLRSAHLFRAWSDDVTVLTDGCLAVSDEDAQRLLDAGFDLRTERIKELRGQDGRLESVLLEDGSELACRGMFVHNEQQQTALVRGLGLHTDDDGFVVVPKDYRLSDPRRPLMETSVPGLYAAGDVTGESQDAVLATFEGTMAGRKVFFDSLAEGGS
jgi:thioredoxin reductase